MSELCHKQTKSTLICEDNKAAKLIAENECSSVDRSKHIDVRYKFVAQAVTERSVRVRHTPTDMNLADELTKAVPAATFERLVKLCLDSKRDAYLQARGLHNTERALQRLVAASRCGSQGGSYGSWCKFK